MIDDAIELATDAMETAKARLAKELARIRTGRANPALLEDIRADNYGSMMPLNQMSTITVGDARLLVVKPWDRNLIQTIQGAIANAGIGLNPNNDGMVVRVPIPPLTEERRKQLVKQVRDAGEDAKIAVRQGRKDANDLLKEAKDDGGISEDDLDRGRTRVQEITDKYVKQIEESVTRKEAEILD